MVLTPKLPKKEGKEKVEEATKEFVSTNTKDNKEIMMNFEVPDMTTQMIVKHNKLHSKTKYIVDNIRGVLKKTKKT